MRRPSILCLTLLLVLSCVAHADDRLALNGKINNQPMHLAFDTGASRSVLFRKAAERLGLKITKVDYKEPLAPGKVPVDLAEECTLDIGSGPQKFTFWVIDIPGNIPTDIDGFLSWSDSRNYVIEIDAEKPGWGVLEDLPSDLRGWAKWKLMPDSDLLAFECANDKESTKIGIDTGSPDGVALSPQRWQKWRAKRAAKPATVDASV